jgi:hypothetical protein
MLLLDAGNVPDGYSTGWMYDAKRRLVYGFTVLGEAWAIKIEPKTARLSAPAAPQQKRPFLARWVRRPTALTMDVVIAGGMPPGRVTACAGGQG